MKTTFLTAILALAISVPAFSSVELIRGENNSSRREEVVTVDCLEGTMKECSKYQFELKDRETGKVIFKSGELSPADTQARIENSLKMFPTRFNVGPLIAVTGLSLVGCIGLGQGTGIKGFCAFIPAAALIDIAKAPIVLPFLMTGYAARNIRFQSIVHKVSKIMAGKKAKPAKIPSKHFANMANRLIFY